MASVPEKSLLPAIPCASANPWQKATIAAASNQCSRRLQNAFMKEWACQTRQFSIKRGGSPRAKIATAAY